MRALEIDGITKESCVALLFEDYLDEFVGKPSKPEDPDSEHYRVTQVGPPRRNTPPGET